MRVKIIQFPFRLTVYMCKLSLIYYLDRTWEWPELKNQRHLETSAVVKTHTKRVHSKRNRFVWTKMKVHRYKERRRRTQDAHLIWSL